VAVLCLQNATAMKKTLALMLALLAAPAAFADTATKTDAPKADAPKTDSAKAKLTPAELQVLAHYHAVNQMEIDLGKAAKQKGASAGVKEYGEMLIKDHTESDTKLKALAKKSGQTIPAEKPATDVEKQEKATAQANAAKLKKQKGSSFDAMFLTAMVDGHEKELAKIDTKIAEVQSPELADLLRAKKPMLQHHADHARELQKNDAQAMQ
jgi:putative membrane protein